MKQARSKQVNELLDGQPGLANDRPQRAPVKLIVVGHTDSRQGRSRSMNHMTAPLPGECEAGFPSGARTTGEA